MLAADLVDTGRQQRDVDATARAPAATTTVSPASVPPHLYADDRLAAGEPLRRQPACSDDRQHRPPIASDRNAWVTGCCGCVKMSATWPALDDMPAVDHHDFLGELADHRHLVGDQHDRDAELAVDVGEQVEDRAGGLRIERRGRLVGQQHVRPGRQRAAQCRCAASGRPTVPTDSGRICRRCRRARAAPRRARLISALDQPAISSGSAILSAAVRDDSRLKCWKIMPIERCASRSSRPANAEMSRPSTMTRPVDGFSSPLIEPDQARFAGAGTADHAGDRAARDREVDRLASASTLGLSR